MCRIRMMLVIGSNYRGELAQQRNCTWLWLYVCDALGSHCRVISMTWVEAMTKYARRHLTFVPQRSSSTKETLHMSYMHVGMVYRGRHTDGQTSVYIRTDRQTDRQTHRHTTYCTCMVPSPVQGSWWWGRTGTTRDADPTPRDKDQMNHRGLGCVWASTVLASIVKHSPRYCTTWQQHCATHSQHANIA